MTDYVKIEKEVWESTIRASMDRAGELEKVKKQLEIAKTALILLLQGEKTVKHKDGAEELIETYALAKIQELDK